MKCSRRVPRQRRSYTPHRLRSILDSVGVWVIRFHRGRKHAPIFGVILFEYILLRFQIEPFDNLPNHPLAIAARLYEFDIFNNFVNILVLEFLGPLGDDKCLAHDAGTPWAVDGTVKDSANYREPYED